MLGGFNNLEYSLLIEAEMVDIFIFYTFISIGRLIEY